MKVLLTARGSRLGSLAGLAAMLLLTSCATDSHLMEERSGEDRDVSERSSPRQRFLEKRGRSDDERGPYRDDEPHGSSDPPASRRDPEPAEPRLGERTSGWTSSRQETPKEVPSVPSPRLPTIAELLDPLQKRSKAEKAFWKLTSVEEELIPDLLDKVTSDEPTSVTRITVLVIDRSFVKHEKLFLASEIPGLGLMEEFDAQGKVVSLYYTKNSYSVARNRRGYRVTIDNIHGFPLGVVVRSAMINRFIRAAYERGRKPRYPHGIDHQRHLRSWWQAYYGNMRGSLRLEM